MQLSFRSILCLAFDPLIFQCAPGKNRTYDLLDRNQTLYPLSYGRNATFVKAPLNMEEFLQSVN